MTAACAADSADSLAPAHLGHAADTPHAGESSAVHAGLRNSDKGVGSDRASFTSVQEIKPNVVRWVPVRSVNPNISDEAEEIVAKRKSYSDADRLSLEEYSRKVRPIFLGVDNVEYAMDDAQVLDYARTILRDRGRGDELFSDGEKPDEDYPQRLRERENQLSGGVYDGESRQNYNGNAHLYPWNNIGTIGSRCSLFKLINNYTAVTSAHCLYNSGGWRRSSLHFAAGAAPQYRPAALPSNCYGMLVPSGWINDVGDEEYDYAVIRLREGGATGAWCNVTDYGFGAFGYQGVSGNTSGISGSMAGYPGKITSNGTPPPGSWSYPSLFNDFRTNGWTSWLTWPNHVWYYNDNSGGMSGGPYWSYLSASQRVRAINMSIHHGASSSNAGRRIDSDTIAHFNAGQGW